MEKAFCNFNLTKKNERTKRRNYDDLKDRRIGISLKLKKRDITKYRNSISSSKKNRGSTGYPEISNKIETNDEIQTYFNHISNSMENYYERKENIAEKMKLITDIEKECDSNIRKIKEFLLKSKRNQMKLMSHIYTEKLNTMVN